MTQTRQRSALESVTNVVVGYLVAIAAQVVVFPFFGIQIGWGSHLGIGLFFTAVSLVRSYTLRRIFNAWDTR